jgi:hypothetical protein
MLLSGRINSFGQQAGGPPPSETAFDYSISYNVGQSAIIDYGRNALSVTNSGVVYSSQSPYAGTNSGSLDITGGDYVDATSSNFTFGTGDFTIACFVNWTSTADYGCLFEGASGGGSRSNSFVITIFGNGITHVFYNGGFGLNTGVALDAGWNHFALTRSGGTTRIFTNGVLRNSVANLPNVTTNFCRIGRIADASGGMVAKIANYTIVKGTALYTADFTPPTVERLTGYIL